jgi:hypothetical protein
MIQIGIVERDAVGSASGVWESLDFNSSLMRQPTLGLWQKGCCWREPFFNVAVTRVDESSTRKPKLARVVVAVTPRHRRVNTPPATHFSQPPEAGGCPTSDEASPLPFATGASQPQQANFGFRVHLGNTAAETRSPAIKNPDFLLWVSS